MAPYEVQTEEVKKWLLNSGIIWFQDPESVSVWFLDTIMIDLGLLALPFLAPPEIFKPSRSLQTEGHLGGSRWYTQESYPAHTFPCLVEGWALTHDFWQVLQGSLTSLTSLWHPSTMTSFCCGEVRANTISLWFSRIWSSCCEFIPFSSEPWTTMALMLLRERISKDYMWGWRTHQGSWCLLV
jgi:hypothetical protein